jgi:hypothetical protein
MVATIPYNPNPTTVAGGAFTLDSNGYVQGDQLPDPAIIYKRASGVLSTSETIPAWGGIGIYTYIGGGTGNPNGALGTIVGRATTLTSGVAGSLAAFAVWSYGMITSPQSPVPLAASGMQVQYFRLGSGARIVVKADPNLINLRGDPTTQPVSWDFANQMLVPYLSTTIASSATYTSQATVSSGTYNPATGLVTLTMAGAHGLSVGDNFALSAVTGTGAFAQLDGTWAAAAGTTGSTLTFYGPTGLVLTITGGTNGTGVISLPLTAGGLNPGDTFELSALTGTGSYAAQNGEHTASFGTTGTTLTYLVATGLTLTITGGTVATGGILPVQVLDVKSTNCQVVNWDGTNATWNYNGAAAVILI